MIGPRRIYPKPKAGLDYYVKELSEYLAKKGNRVTIYCHPNSSPTVFPLPVGIQIQTIWTLPRHHLDTFCYGLLATLHALFQKGEIIHYHGGAALFAGLARMSSKKIVVTIHSGESHSRHIPWYWRLGYFFGEWLGIKMSHGLSTVSQTLNQAIQNLYGAESLALPLGFSPKNCRTAEILKAIGLKPKQYCLFLGRLDRGKGVELLLKAFQNLQSDIPLVLAGAPLFDTAYFNTIQKGAHPQILFMGEVSGQLKEELLANALLYVQASQAEGLSLSLLEAMSYGLPALVSDIPQNVEALGGAGLYFRSGDAEDLYLQLKKQLALGPALLKEIGERARQRIEKKFLWEKNGPLIEQLYQR